jgi:cell wall-associated NlpC family hydrolase
MAIEYENLVGNPFQLGTYDCLRMVRDFYKQNFDIDIPNYARPTNWNSDTLDLIGLLHSKLGFEKVDTWKLQPGDILATAIGTSKPNHMVIYVGDNMILHHKTGAMSAAETFRPWWKMVTCYVLRHPDVPDMTPVLPEVSIEELLRERYKPLFSL